MDGEWRRRCRRHGGRRGGAHARRSSRARRGYRGEGSVGEGAASVSACTATSAEPAARAMRVASDARLGSDTDAPPLRVRARALRWRADVDVHAWLRVGRHHPAAPCRGGAGRGV